MEEQSEPIVLTICREGKKLELTQSDIDTIISDYYYQKEIDENRQQAEGKILEAFDLFMRNIHTKRHEDEEVQKYFADETLKILRKHFHRCEKCGLSKGGTCLK